MGKYKSYKFRSQSFFVDSLMVILKVIVLLVFISYFSEAGAVTFAIFLLISFASIRAIVWFFSPNLEIMITDENLLYKLYSKNRILSSGSISKDEIKSMYFQYYQLISTIAFETTSGKVIWFECYGWDKYALEEIKEKLNGKRNSFLPR
ncbi:hypothetical protein EHO58_14690 [Leptospira selangorensis]|uniref:hypothetical protein n=1 Tax=Leptospira selangorensis TaxID=2484982 RepID=UPI001082E69A|nr:hypothetical protein [Leptospira selangorensis]TGK03654.1 hypothetical protein EHO58_14690 [Leptospira selangorensis]